METLVGIIVGIAILIAGKTVLDRGSNYLDKKSEYYKAHIQERCKSFCNPNKTIGYIENKCICKFKDLPKE